MGAANKSALKQKALESLLLHEGEVPEKILTAHNACLEEFFAGHIQAAYGFMVPIMEHYHKAKSPLPLACEHLYFALLMQDAAAEGPKTLKAFLDYIAQKKKKAS